MPLLAVSNGKAAHFDWAHGTGCGRGVGAQGEGLAGQILAPGPAGAGAAAENGSAIQAAGDRAGLTMT